MKGVSTRHWIPACAGMSGVWFNVNRSRSRFSGLASRTPIQPQGQTPGCVQPLTVLHYRAGLGGDIMRGVWTAVLCGMAVAGCATITRGTTDQVQINSNPPEAQVRTSMGFTCITPCTLQTSRKDEFSVVFTKPGYHTMEVPVRTQLAGAGAAGFAGNILLGGVVGMAADASTGATLEHFPNPVTVTMVPLRPGEKDAVIKVTPPPPAPKPEEINPRT
jgi:hypothetical protein